MLRPDTTAVSTGRKAPSYVLTLFDACSAMKKVDPLAAIGATGLVNMEKLSKWFYESRLDPNDPANADLIYLLGVSTLRG